LRLFQHERDRGKLLSAPVSQDAGIALINALVDAVDDLDIVFRRGFRDDVFLGKDDRKEHRGHDRHPL
jgi:hypothetical protein